MSVCVCVCSCFVNYLKIPLSWINYDTKWPRNQKKMQLWFNIHIHAVKITFFSPPIKNAFNFDVNHKLYPFNKLSAVRGFVGSQLNHIWFSLLMNLFFSFFFLTETNSSFCNNNCGDICIERPITEFRLCGSKRAYDKPSSHNLWSTNAR